MTFDLLQRFVFDNIPVRGQIIRLQQSYHEISSRHSYPLFIKKILGQALAAASLLSTMLKQGGSIILQAQGDGPLNLLLAQSNASQQIRGLAEWKNDITVEHFAAAMGKGHLAITLDPGVGGERYQGIVPLIGNSLAEVLENYFIQSEQLPTFLYLVSNEDAIAGFLLQAMPNTSAEKQNDQQWEHVVHLAKTLTEDELLNLSFDAVLHRLFHQEQVRLFDPQPVVFQCTCSRDAMARAVRTLGYKDAVELSKQQIVTVTCEFCRKQHNFDRIDIERIFAARDEDSSEGSPTLQ